MTIGRILRPRSTTTRPADNTAYQGGDEISNSATAGSVVRATFDLSGIKQGRILAAALDVTAASSNVVTTASDFELLIFKTADAPAAVGDNVSLSISAATRALAVARFRFDDTGWFDPLGTVAAGASQFQQVLPTMVQPLASNVAEYPQAFGFPFTFEGGALTGTGAYQFTAVLRALAAWTPTGIVNTFGITLDIEAI